MMLITVGVAIARLTTQKIEQAVWLSLIKLVVCFALGMGFGGTLRSRFHRVWRDGPADVHPSRSDVLPVGGTV